eukprot:c21278_g1_i1 orf=211-738(+)
MAPAKTRTSKDLLRLEHCKDSPTPGAKWLSICKPKKEQNVIPSSSKTMPLESLAGEGSVLSRVRAFLPVLDEANRKLAEAIKEKGPEDYDIEVLKRHEETAYVEMDLALGVADLHSSDAVSAAERLTGGQVVDTTSSRNVEGLEDESGNLSSEGEEDAMDLLINRKKQPRIEPLS